MRLILLKGSIRSGFSQRASLGNSSFAFTKVMVKENVTDIITRGLKDLLGIMDALDVI